MKLHRLEQGSPEWHAHRNSGLYFNASDAPAMLGCSPYETRRALLDRLASGIRPDVGAATERLFQDGHRFEALSRPIGAELIGDDLFPVVGSQAFPTHLKSHELSASFDGLPMDDPLPFEHKSVNEDLRAALPHEGIENVARNSGHELPKVYRVQLEQQLAVCGGTRALFMASRWSREDALVEVRCCWYNTDPALRQEILLGWAVFENELDGHIPQAAAAEAIAAPTEAFPVVLVQLTGSLTVESNLAIVKTALAEWIAKLPEMPSTDQEFADTEAACKRLEALEKALLAEEDRALASMADVQTMRNLMAECRELSKATRLEKVKLVDRRKVEIRTEHVNRGKKALAEHVAALNVRLGKPYMPTITADFAGAIKGKRNVQSVKDAVDQALAAAKIESNRIADGIQINLNMMREVAKDHAFLFADTPGLVLKSAEDCRALVENRIAAHKQEAERRAEAERARIRAEEVARLQREEQAREAERQRQAEAEARASAPQPTAAPATPPATPPLTTAHATVDSRPPAVVPMRGAAPRAMPPSTPPSLKIGEINERLGVCTVTAGQLQQLGFAGVRDRGAVLFHDGDFPLMVDALVAHMRTVQAKHQQKAA